MAVVLNLLVAVNLLVITWACPEHAKRRMPALTGFTDVRNNDEIKDMNPPVVTLASIKTKLKETGIIDPDNTTLTEMERKELKKLFDTIEIMMTSRARQPSNVQSVFSSLRMVERVVKKQTRDGQISKSLADKFQWSRLPPFLRMRRDKPMYHLDKDKNMRIFNL